MRASGSRPLSPLTCRRELRARPLAQAHQQQLAVVALRAAPRYVQLSPQIHLEAHIARLLLLSQAHPSDLSLGHKGTSSWHPHPQQTPTTPSKP